MADPLLDPLLTYVLAADPDPLVISTPAAPQQGRINLGVFSRGAQLYCDEIMIAVPVGSAATDAYLQPPVSSLNTARWVAQAVKLVPGDELGLTAGQEYATYTFAPRDPTDDAITYSLVFGLTGTVAPVPGTFGYAVQENSGTTPDRNAYQSRQAVFGLTKNAAQLYVRNLVARSAGQPGIPATQVAAGEELRLEWSSTGTWFELYAGDQLAPVYSGPHSFCSLEHGITRDTTFFLLASATGDPGGDSGQGGYQTIYAFASLTVAVTSPSLPTLSVRSLQASTLVLVGENLITDNSAALQALNVKGPTFLGKLSAASVVAMPNDDSVPVYATSHSAANGAAVFINAARGTPGQVPGVYSQVAQQSDVGFFTNGQISSHSGLTALTHLPTGDGYRVVTSPLVTEPEVHVSGSARLTSGRAQVDLEPDVADLICQSDDTPYRVFLTPAGPCGPLMVTKKQPGYFLVQESADGSSDAPFDWLVIARQRAAPAAAAANSSPEPMRLPAMLPLLAPAPHRPD